MDEVQEQLEDPACNPRDPKTLIFCRVKHARDSIEPHVVKTPCLRSRLSKKVEMNLFLKAEFMQYTGSFKERGARYALMNIPKDKRKNGAVAASAGNHAQAMCYHGSKVGVPITVVMPETAAIMKIQRCRDMGANVVVKGKTLLESKNIAMTIARDTGAIYVNGYDNLDVLAGQGTVGIEILEQVPDVNAIVIPVGGGSLLAGVTVSVKKLKPCTKIIGVESESCSSFANGLSRGTPVFTSAKPTLADGLAVSTVGYNSLATVLAYGVDKMISVSEEDIAVAILRLLESEKFVIEGAGATSLAAVLSGQLDEFKGQNVVLVLTGGNIDTTILGRCLERGLAADGRLVKLYVTVSDRPGGAAELYHLIASAGVTIKKVHMERAWITFDVFSVYVKVVCETRNFAHALELEHLLKRHYKQVDLVHAPFPISSDAEGPCETTENYNYSMCQREVRQTSPAPRKVTFESIASASLLIRPAVEKTACNFSRLSQVANMNLYLKNEYAHYTGSVKERGARHSLLKLSSNQRQKGVVVSGGNHALSMAWHGFQLGIPITVVMPVTAPMVNVQKCTKFKADVIVEGRNMLESQGVAVNLAREKGASFINGCDDSDVIAGQGTVGLEILEQVPNVHCVVVPTGGGGLLAGVATAIKTLRPCVKVIGVEPVACRSFANALAAGRPELTECQPTLADGLAVSIAGGNALEIAKNYTDGMIAVQEEDISLAVLRLIENEKCIVEGAGAAPLAAALSGQLREFEGKNVVLILSGGNIDTTLLGRVIERGLASDGRLLKVYVTVSDRPGGLAELCKLVASVGVSIKHIGQERAYVNFDIYSVQVKLVCETRDYEHALELEKLLKAHYKVVDMIHAPFPNSSNAEPAMRRM